MDSFREAASRRVRTLAGHVAPDGTAPGPPLLARSATAASTSLPYASATGVPTSYARVRVACAGPALRHVRDRACCAGARPGVSRARGVDRRVGRGRATDGGAVREGEGRGHRQGAPWCRRRACAHVSPATRAAQITINRPERRNAFTPRTGALLAHAQPARPPRADASVVCSGTVKELSWCFRDARDDSRVGIVILTGAWR